MKYPAGLSGDEYAAMEDGYDQGFEAGFQKGQASIVSKVVSLWNAENGWIPGASYERLAAILDIPVDRLKHYNSVERRHHVPEGEGP